MCGVSEPLQCLACSVLSRFRAQVGIPVVPLSSPLLGVFWVIHCHPSFCPVFPRFASKTQSFDPVIVFVPPLGTDDFVFLTMSSPCGKFLDGSSSFDMEQSPLLVVLKIVVSLFSPPSPPDRPGSRDEIPCWWCCIVTAQFSQKL